MTLSTADSRECQIVKWLLNNQSNILWKLLAAPWNAPTLGEATADGSCGAAAERAQRGGRQATAQHSTGRAGREGTIG